MSDFWKSPLGEVTGSFEDSFSSGFEPIPDGTKAIAKIDKFQRAEYDQSAYYEVTWVITQGAYANRHVFQKIRVWDTDEKKRHRALNMLKYMYKLFGVRPNHSGEPLEHELAQAFVNKYAGICIGVWKITTLSGDEKTGNYIQSVFDKSKMQNNTPAVTPDNLPTENFDDIPF